MDKVKQLKLAIFERENRGEITAEERDILLEAVEEKYSEECTDELLEESTEEGPELEGNPIVLSEDASDIMEMVESGDIDIESAISMIIESGDIESANKIFLDNYRSAYRDYDTIIKEIKDHIKDEEFIKAKAKILIAKAKLKKIKSLTVNTPSTLGDNLISSLVKVVASSASAALGVFIGCFGDNDTTSEKIGKISAGVALGAAGGALSAAFDAGNNIRKYGTPNAFKAMAIKSIDANIVLINKLEKKLSNKATKAKNEFIKDTKKEVKELKAEAKKKISDAKAKAKAIKK